jgi:hypothetical protein
VWCRACVGLLRDQCRGSDQKVGNRYDTVGTYVGGGLDVQGSIEGNEREIRAVDYQS